MHIAIMFIFLSMLSNEPEIAVPPIEINDTSYEEKDKQSNNKSISIILEVEGNPKKHQKYIEDYYPSIEVVATYTTLFQGIALKGPSNKLERLVNSQFIKGIYPVQTYTTLKKSALTVPLHNVEGLHSLTKKPNINIPYQLNNTNYTGKGVKIAVIDTGVDFTHPDLKENYAGGFDLIDLDDQPMETTIDQGIPTSHGTHVAGIIAANGDIRGVAPDGKIYAYRALGPGGVGTSIQVIAAMEEAVKAGVDIMNLSLGNIVNGPDYPTSKAVNEASRQGIAVVVANGNDGPVNWSVGAPATAASALSVGAYQDMGQIPFLYEGKNRKKIPLSPLKKSPSWSLGKDYEITTDTKDVTGKIGMIKQNDKPLVDQLLKIQEAGAVAAVIHYMNPKSTEWMAGLQEVEVNIPVALISKKDGNWIAKYIEKEILYFKNEIEKTNEMVANFSSRGPVTLNWMLKPDVIAPGVNIVSTVPGGYDLLNGTSMAAPHVAGALAVMKEAHPSWPNEKHFGALKTTSKQIKSKTGGLVEPIVQGAGLINIENAINTQTIIYDPLLSFGNIRKHVADRKINVSIENVSNDRQQFYFDIPKKNKGFSWNLPKSFSVEAKETKDVPVQLKINSLQLKKGIHQGHLQLHSGNDSYYLPYVFINETADYPKVMGFSIQLDKLNKKVYEYQLYVAEAIKSVQIQLFDPKSLMYEGELMKLTELDVGMNKGEIKKSKVKKSGLFYGLIIVQLENGEFVNYETEVLIE